MALLTKVFVYLFRHRRIPGASAVSLTTPQSDDTGLVFAALAPNQQLVAEEYFAATSNLMQTVKFIREHKRAVDVEMVLLAFEQAERSFHWHGMRPVFPPAINSADCLDPEKLIELGLLARFGKGEKVVMYAAGMRSYINKMVARYQPKQLESTR